MKQECSFIFFFYISKHDSNYLLLLTSATLVGEVKIRTTVTKLKTKTSYGQNNIVLNQNSPFWVKWEPTLSGNIAYSVIR